MAPIVGRPVLLSVWFVLIFSFRVVHAESVAEHVFGKWEKVTVKTMLKPVPEWVSDSRPGAYGAVQPKSPKAEILPDECYLYAGAERVGARLNCSRSSGLNNQKGYFNLN